MEMTSMVKSNGIDLYKFVNFMLLNTCIFHEAVANKLGIKSLKEVKWQPTPVKDLLDEWNKILNCGLSYSYKVIFTTPTELLKRLQDLPDISDILKNIIDLALKIDGSGVIRKYDFIGRLYHKLLLDTTGKFYATFFTSIPASVVLSYLLVNYERSYNFGNLSTLKNLKILDPACGSGTLLLGVYQAIRDCILELKQISSFHKIMLEKVLYGFDVLNYATHLTLLSLILQNPNVLIERSNIYTLKYGIEDNEVYLGSLDIIDKVLFKQMGTVNKLNAIENETIDIDREMFDFIVMNPPFSRSAKPNLKHGFVKNREIKQRMDKKEKTLREKLGLKGTGPAGLAALFVILGLELLKKGGRLGLILPRSCLAGSSWSKIRESLLKNCNLLCIVSNFHSAPSHLGGWNWSENTDLAEVILIAEKIRETNRYLSEKRGDKDRGILIINFTKRPSNQVVAKMSVFKALDSIPDKFIEDDNGTYSEVKVETFSHAYIYKIREETFRLLPNFQVPCVFANPLINRFILRILIENSKSERKFLVPLSRLIEKDSGIDISQVKRLFEMTESITPYHIIWGQKGSMNTLEIPDSVIGYGKAKDSSKARELYQKYSSTLLLSERPHLSNDPVICFASKKPVLCTAMWELKPKKPNFQTLLTLWFNSTIGLLLYLSVAVNSQKDIFKLKKKHFDCLYVINPDLLDQEDFEKLDDLFDKLSTKTFLKLREETWSAGSPRTTIDGFFVSLLSKLGCKESVNLETIYNLIKEDPVVAP